MVERIKKIRQVGAFIDFKTGGPIELGRKKVTVIFGLNRRGKSTLSDIFQSIGANDPGYIISRSSIPSMSGIPQEVELSYSSGTGSEQTLSFKSGCWSSDALKNKILVFDQSFADRNVMTGSAITRDNKEQFTDFVLGDEGVKLSNAIETDNKDLRLQRSTLRTFRPKYTKSAANDKEVEEFVKLHVAENREDIEKQLEADTKRMARLENIEKFKLLKVPELKVDSLERSVKDAMDAFEALLKRTYADVSDEAWRILNNHITENCDGEESVSWLKTGLKINKSRQCPYCGQPLHSAQSLITAYQSLFDVKFDEYETAVDSEITILRARLRTLLATSISSQLTTFIVNTETFSPYIPELDEMITRARKQLDTLTTQEAECKNALAIWESEVQGLLKHKEQSSHKRIKDTSNTKILLEQLALLTNTTSPLVEMLNSILAHIKETRQKIDQLNDPQVAAEKLRLRGIIEQHNRKLARLDQAEESSTYATKLGEIAKLSDKIARSTIKLEAEQTAYLKKYFARVNHWFRQLGSHGFTIEQETNNKGDKKVYYLRLLFNGQRIGAEHISKVFSESDRRNLAFSVFLSKAEQLVDRLETILVLDDPVVSFDDNRIDKTCRELKLIAPSYRQVIVLTHYKSLVKEIARCNIDANFVEIDSSTNGSSLIQMDASKLTMSLHENACDRICSFIDGANDPDILKLLRPFMEEHLKLIFQQQVRANKLEVQQLADLIDSLKSIGLIDGTVQAKLHAFRESFNPDHHGTDSQDNVESVRTDAADMMDLLYSTLITR